MSCNNESNFGKVFLGFVGGAALGAALGILFAPAKGAATRRHIAKTGRDLKNQVVDKLEDLVESAEEIVEDLKESAGEFVNKVEDEYKAKKQR
ncbi:YtxH domain-containing protein [Bacteroidales bacterium OttesenSCG-928-I21]|nr:YtxH domain-containing protein [Bacteroidales bacterium OttesenSCG-928-I21]